eukprot:Plantae.Rhodophyta-Hildenbrandia_rubra.ctg2490.p1 GENE.Plantae.Rhodophyta-Hildenbrandia_rubra.ctg2490~~Plantae.Rhodophyta-Hildenbrandia_rubra.ctg2490.p1  ORF type:complete len:488 (-),score=82.12 Plantae.Rhodophyta-Hildenbrandia_rubra.ctg2490:334-1797(-)
MFCTAKLPGMGMNHEVAKQQFPIPIVKLKRSVAPPVMGSGVEMTHHLGKKVNPKALDGAVEANAELREQYKLCNTHKRSSYCCRDGRACKSYFPKWNQERASISLSDNNPELARLVTNYPRNDPHINATHPMLIASFHANTDVSVIYSSGVVQCCYVVSYGVKGEKDQFFNWKSARRLERMSEEDIASNEKLLGAIGRSADSVRLVGGQEVASNILGHPLTFKSHKILYFNPSYMLSLEGALNASERKAQETILKKKSADLEGANVLVTLDPDEAVAVGALGDRSDLRCSQRWENLSKQDEYVNVCVQRPRVLEELSLFEFTARHTESVVGKTARNIESNMAMIGANDSGMGKMRIARRRRRVAGSRSETTHILAVAKRGCIDDSAPLFAAGALLLHAPFRGEKDLLGGKTIVMRFQSCMGDPQCYAKLFEYVENSHDVQNTQEKMKHYCELRGKKNMEGNKASENNEKELLEEALEAVGDALGEAR